MEANPHSSYLEEEDYINMEVDSSVASSIFRRHSSTKEFEFQSFSSSSEKDHTTTSPADELFYMGKLLPLHLPPRLEMVHNILQNPASFHSKSKPFEDDEPFTTPLFMTPTANTPFESCNVSPSESCHVSRELCPDEYFLDYQEKKSWTKKLKLIKQSSSSSHFQKPSNERMATQRVSSLSGKSSATKTAISWRSIVEGGSHRRSFSGAFKRLSKPKTSAISPSNPRSEICNRQGLNRSSSSSSELENPIQAAIAHCKRSQQQLYSRQMANELGFCSVSASSRVIYDEQERPGLCRG
ncbi:UNVERIFIED_CONTAM: putative membrane-associated kinase regulator 4 [Sesamum angustifolium]|uniref:Membrane-associated kinase regulator 4 n=1 Tax=Sesamum angustifolium TaxID=2727405 RepID=A0AAW2NZC5_9LAMI